MNALNKLALLSVAAVGLVAATPAQARDHHHYSYRGHSYHGGHAYYQSYGRPYYYSGYQPYYYSRPAYVYDSPYAYDGYYGQRYYSPGPTISFAFGGSRWHGYHHHHR